MASEIRGIQQSDILIRSAIVQALQNLRDDPTQLDDVFATLTQDDLTAGTYGDAQIQSAKEWFLSQEVPVFMSYRFDEAKAPCISIGLQDSTEAEMTTADVHYLPQEDTEASWPPLAGPFTPVHYAPSSGLMVVPAAALGQLVLEPGMNILDSAGRPYLITQVPDDDTIGIQPNIATDFSDAVIKGPKPRLISAVESVNFKETYIIGCHVMSNSTFLTYLHSIVLYALLKFNQDLLERRGVERATFSSAEFRRNDVTQSELLYSRAIIITAYVRQSWRKSKNDRIQATNSSGLIMEKADFTGTATADLIESAANGFSVEDS